VDFYYSDKESPEYEEALWVINRMVEGGLSTPTDFLEYHQQKAGYRGMRGSILEADTEKYYDEFAKQVIQAAY
jgi:hypothetical protein